MHGQQVGSGNSQINNVTYIGNGQSRERPRRVRVGLPRVVESFTARQAELVRLDQGWPAASSGQPPVQVVTGLPGVGKTQLLAAYTVQNAATYDVVAWVRAVDPITDLVRLAGHLGVIEARRDP